MLRVEMGEQRAARHVASDDQVVAGGENCGAAFDLDNIRSAERAQPNNGALYSLAQQVPAERVRHVVEGDDREASQQQATEALLGFFLVTPGGGDGTRRPVRIAAASRRMGFAAACGGRAQSMSWHRADRTTDTWRDQPRQPTAMDHGRQTESR